MSRNQRVQATLLCLLLGVALVLASCGPLSARVDTSELEAVVGVRHGMEINLEDIPPTGVPVKCHGQAPAGVASIELYVNGIFLGRSNNTAAPGTHESNYFTAEMSFEPDGPGAYDLRCRTQDQEGRSVNSAEVTIFLIGEVPTSTTVPPEIPTATPTSTEAPPPEVPPPPTATEVPPTATRIPPTATRIPPTSTPPPPTPTPPPPIIVSFEVVQSNGCFHFTWRVEGDITAIRFDGEGVGNYPDSRDRCPTATRAYELHAEGPGGTDTESVTVVVTPGDTEGPVIGRFGHSPGLIFWDEDDSCAPDDPIQATINAYNISDPSGVDSVKVTYRVVEVGRPAGQWQAKPMNQVQTGVYSASIGANDLELSLNPPVSYGHGNQSTLEYYIQAFDGVGNRSDSSTRTLTVEYCYKLY